MLLLPNCPRFESAVWSEAWAQCFLLVVWAMLPFQDNSCRSSVDSELRKGLEVQASIPLLSG